MTDAASQPRSTAWQNAVTVLQEATPPSIPDRAHAMTIVIDIRPAIPARRRTGTRDLRSARCWKARWYSKLEGEAPRVIRAGETSWEPGGDVIHYQDGNNRDDTKVRFLVAMLCSPGQPMLTLVEEDELVARRDRRVRG